jgi:hypothetical protein
VRDLFIEAGATGWTGVSGVSGFGHHGHHQGRVLFKDRASLSKEQPDCRSPRRGATSY